MATMKKPAKKMQMGGMADSYTNYKIGGAVKAKNGKSFPDLNKDGKITKADILKGRGVIAKKGMKVKKAQTGKTIKQSNADMMKEIDAREKRIAARDSANQRKSYTNERANKVVGKNKMGGMTKKCAYGCK
jgi:hypothetical protein